jgi:hypothetical protein
MFSIYKWALFCVPNENWHHTIDSKPFSTRAESDMRNALSAWGKLRGKVWKGAMNLKWFDDCLQGNKYIQSLELRWCWNSNQVTVVNGSFECRHKLRPTLLLCEIMNCHQTKLQSKTPFHMWAVWLAVCLAVVPIEHEREREREGFHPPSS